MRLIDIKFLKNIFFKNVARLKQTISEMEELNMKIKLKIKEVEIKDKNLPEENLFDFVDCLEEERKENEIDLGLFLELALQCKIF